MSAVVNSLDLLLTAVAVFLQLCAGDFLIRQTHLGFARDRYRGAAPYGVAWFIIQVVATILIRRWTDPLLAYVVPLVSSGEQLDLCQNMVTTGNGIFHFHRLFHNKPVLGNMNVVVDWR